MNDFKEDLEFSNSHEMSSWWDDCYRKAFPTMSACVSIRSDGWAQRGGIDRRIVLSCGRTITIDEKVRRKDYGDVLLEIWSDLEKKTPGWAIKPLACDYIAYAISPINKCYLFPTLNLQIALQNNKNDWHQFSIKEMNGFSYKDAKNNGWITRNMSVPTEILLDAIKNSIIIELNNE